MHERILLMEDDPTLAETLVDLLESEGYAVTLTGDGEAAADAAYDGGFDLYLFDVNVPRLNGFDLLGALREAEDKTPTIFITALTDTASLSKGFASGAEDYIKKPFDPEELLIRIAARCRRKSSTLVYGTVTYDPASRTLYLEGEPVDMGEVPKNLFVLLLEHLGQNVDKSLLYDVMENPSDSALRVHINTVKKRLGVSIDSVRSVGYRLPRLKESR